MHALVRGLTEKRLPALRRSHEAKWAVALAVLGTAFAVRYFLDDYLRPGLPFISFFIALLIITLVSGATVGVVSLLVSTVAAWFFFVEPVRSFAVEQVLALVLYTLFGSLIVAIAHQLNLTIDRLATERAHAAMLLSQKEQAETQLVQLNQELVHRIRNVFALAGALTKNVERHTETSAEMSAALTKRFNALACAQDALAANKLIGADLTEIAERILSPLAPGQDRLHVDGSPIILPPDKVTSLCLVLHELATNAVKYGAWSNGVGAVHLHWKLEPNDVIDLQWIEADGPPCVDTGRTGLGSILIDRVIRGAEVHRDLRPEGLCCSVKFPRDT